MGLQCDFCRRTAQENKNLKDIVNSLEHALSGNKAIQDNLHAQVEFLNLELDMFKSQCEFLKDHTQQLQHDLVILNEQTLFVHQYSQRRKMRTRASQSPYSSTAKTIRHSPAAVQTPSPAMSRASAVGSPNVYSLFSMSEMEDVLVGLRKRLRGIRVDRKELAHTVAEVRYRLTGERVDPLETPEKAPTTSEGEMTLATSDFAVMVTPETCDKGITTKIGSFYMEWSSQRNELKDDVDAQRIEISKLKAQLRLAEDKNEWMQKLSVKEQQLTSTQSQLQIAEVRNKELYSLVEVLRATKTSLWQQVETLELENDALLAQKPAMADASAQTADAKRKKKPMTPARSSRNLMKNQELLGSPALKFPLSAVVNGQTPRRLAPDDVLGSPVNSFATPKRLMESKDQVEFSTPKDQENRAALSSSKPPTPSTQPRKALAPLRA